MPSRTTRSAPAHITASVDQVASVDDDSSLGKFEIRVSIHPQQRRPKGKSGRGAHLKRRVPPKPPEVRFYGPRDLQTETHEDRYYSTVPTQAQVEETRLIAAGYVTQITDLGLRWTKETKATCAAPRQPLKPSSLPSRTSSRLNKVSGLLQTFDY